MEFFYTHGGSEVLKKLTINIKDFRNINMFNKIYVDKLKEIWKIVSDPG